MGPARPAPLIRVLIGYYGGLQTGHLLLLIRASWFLVQGRPLPFPAAPPPGGWTQSALPFLLGMGLVDLIAIGLGLRFAFDFFFQDKVNYVLGLISVSAALSSGTIYMIGTIPSGAWAANSVGYVGVVLLFSPILPLFWVLITGARTE